MADENSSPRKLNIELSGTNVKSGITSGKIDFVTDKRNALKRDESGNISLECNSGLKPDIYQDKYKDLIAGVAESIPAEGNTTAHFNWHRISSVLNGKLTYSLQDDKNLASDQPHPVQSLAATIDSDCAAPSYIPPTNAAKRTGNHKGK
jgi:hypothetical protein